MSCCDRRRIGWACQHCQSCGVSEHERGSKCLSFTAADLVRLGFHEQSRRVDGHCVDGRSVKVTKSVKSVKELLALQEASVIKEAGKKLGGATRVYTTLNGINGSVWYARRVHRGKEIELFFMNASDFAQDRARRDLAIWTSGCACITSPFL
jgi:hypothetical protein